MARSTSVRFAAGAVLAGATRVLLHRMAGDFERDQRLRPSTTVLVYGAYAVQLAAITELSAYPTIRLPIPPPVDRVLAGTLIAAGTGALVAGAGNFGSAGQLSGIETGRLVETGAYRWSRNPQYLGYLSILAGASVASRSLDATLATAASAAVFNHWIDHEEANLTRTFGSDYTRYREHTARWLRIPART